MATGGYNSRDARWDDRSSSARRTDVREQNRMTSDVFANTKSLLEKKKQRGDPIDKTAIEEMVFNAKNTLDSEKFDLELWNRKMSSKHKPVDQEIVLVSMAYANEIEDALPIYHLKTKEKDPQSSKESADLSDAIGALKKTKRDLERKSQPNLSSIIRNMDKKETERANRLFYSEIRHYLPHLDRFTIADADYVVRGIQDTRDPLKEPNDLLPLVKSCSSYDDVKCTIEATARDREDNQSDSRRDPPRNTTESYNRSDTRDRDQPPPPRQSMSTHFRTRDDDRDHRRTHDSTPSPRSSRRGSSPHRSPASRRSYRLHDDD